MKVIDLTPEHNNNYFNCLSEWSDEMQEAGDHKACWYNKYKEKGLRVKLALDEKGTVGGMIQYLPIEESFVEGKDLYFILCIWVHGYKEGRGDFQGIGMGEALLGAAESDAKEKGAKGMAAWGVWLPFWMKASWFKKHGYKKADRDSMSLLVYGWCPAQNMVYERAKRASAECGEKVIFQGIDTSDRDVFLEWGISDAIFVNGKQVAFGPPLSYEKLMKIIFKQVKKLST
ncbi:MAG: GNAT family N-acetyltransferase [Gammaproteobacteria bacterium]